MTIGQAERVTQNRVVALFVDELKYRYLGHWQDRAGNSNVEEAVLGDYLTRAGYRNEQISRAIHSLKVEASNRSRTLYENNKAVYSLLRYGVPVKAEAGENTESIQLINWETPEANDFGIAEEVTVHGQHEKRPDVVLYVNGIALGVLELKNSRKSIGNGIRQNINNQKPEFIGDFFATMQLVLAGNDSEGLRYGTVGTPEKYYLKWKEDEDDNARLKLDKYLLKLCDKKRFLEIVYDFVLFDGGIKKVPRHHQYFGIKAAQERIARKQGGIIWHTQGSGKSIVMVLLAKWILENNPEARVVVVTDRDELDKQIESVFSSTGEKIHRTRSGRDLMSQLSQAKPRLLCSLVHKFGKKGVDDFDRFIRELESQPSATVGELYVFVDECHRTQSGKLHRTMKALIPQAIFIGFTGTPLLRRDKQTTLEVFERYIHTYRFGEAVEDEVVLDLVYEARDIDQRLGSPEKVDAWFDSKTRGLNDWQRAALREQWGTKQKVLSSRSRMDRVVSDIIFDFNVKPRLSNQRGNAILVASSIHEACKYFELFQNTPFKGKCAVITSYNPQVSDINQEDTGENTKTEKEFVYHLYQKLLKDVKPQGSMTKTEAYEDRSKQLFVEEPARMKLLIVVDKLLTGFDAPSCTYLYIDKSMRDHGLFQAICRTNRLDGEDKDFGYIVDYKDLFQNLVNDQQTGALQVYTSELDKDECSEGNSEILLQDRLERGRQRLEDALESLAALCEPVRSPRGELEHIQYFCGNTEIASDLEEREPRRVALYRSVASLVRAFASVSDELDAAGFNAGEAERIKGEIDRYLKLREIIRRASGETIDLKAYEADMRHLIDTYIEANESRKISSFDETPLVDLIVSSGIDEAVNSLPEEMRNNPESVAETIENNVRSTIIREHLNDPAYYERMSALLDEIIAARRRRAMEYEEYLRRIANLARDVGRGADDSTPSKVRTAGQRAIYNNLQSDTAAEAAGRYAEADSNDPTADLALVIDKTIKQVSPHGWRGHEAKERTIKAALFAILQNEDEVEKIFPILKQQSEY
ncbi:HsdR family type I site-specific deoxyribonuclease [Pelagicoccus sp. SDUM812003]|uniref:type I restriction endonuclease subunit R n=1 Tax=Pelagicoccus sp. SDUM812003 TaxID=3041267 RepID=UPI00280E9BED|nr:HsdR family type I site-specific deoxyribonuclease [Pelagicoccus sp. SDUM812003]MDQ8201485.1 HsdR family type I site-specific deoxyribonuclease [Pelagicoccus sp. SDUM812003]